MEYYCRLGLILGSINTMQIVKHKPKPSFDEEAFLTAMFLMFARTPRNPLPDSEGFYVLGEIGAAPEKDWTRLTPYSIARKDRNSDYENGISRIIDV